MFHGYSRDFRGPQRVPCGRRGVSVALRVSGNLRGILGVIRSVSRNPGILRRYLEVSGSFKTVSYTIKFQDRFSGSQGRFQGSQGDSEGSRRYEEIAGGFRVSQGVPRDVSVAPREL